MTKYPEVSFQLVGTDGNAFAVMGLAAKEARRAGLSKEQIDEYRTEAMSGDYDHLLLTTMRFFDCDGISLDGFDDEWLDDDSFGEDEADAEWDEYWAECDRERDEDND